MTVFNKYIIKDKPIIWVMGPPGAGKGTQCERLYSAYNFAHLSSGELLRQKVMEDPANYREAFKQMSEGHPVPNDVVNSILAEAMTKTSSDPGCNGFLIDGYPLDESQAASFEEYIGEPTIILYLGLINDIVLTERLKNRSNFDDSKNSISNRLATFSEKTKPIINRYKKQSNVINSNRDVEEVYNDIKSIFAKFEIKEVPNDHLKMKN